MCFRALSLIFFIICISDLSFAKQNYNLNVDLHPYYFLKQKDLNGFIHFDFKTQKRTSKNQFYQLHLNAETFNVKNSLNQNYFLNATGTKYLIKSKPFIFSFGFLDHKYGLSRFSSPLDFVDQKAYSDLLNPKRFSDFSLRTSFKLGGTFWRLSYIPFRLDMPYPGNKSFWLPQTLPKTLSDGSNTVIFPNDPTYDWQPYTHLDNSNKNNISIIGNYDTDYWNWVWQYYYGLDTDTNVELELNTTTVSGNTVRTDYPILIHPVHNLIQRLGFGFVYTTPIKWRIVFENSVSLGNENNSANASEEYVYNSSLSLEWGIPVFGDILMGVFQGFYGRSSNNPSGTTTILPPLREALLAGLLWKKKSYELNAAFIKSYSLKIELFQAGIQLNVSPHFYVKSTANFISGSVPEILSGFVDSDIVDGFIGYKTQF